MHLAVGNVYMAILFACTTVTSSLADAFLRNACMDTVDRTVATITYTTHVLLMISYRVFWTLVLALFPLVFLWDSRREAIGTDQWVEKHIRWHIVSCFCGCLAFFYSL